MWSTIGNNIKMSEGDFGISLTYGVTGVTFTDSDSFKFTFKKTINGTAILEKETVPNNGEISLEFTESESALFPVGSYVYSLDWYQNGEFMCNLILAGMFYVEDKA